MTTLELEPLRACGCPACMQKLAEASADAAAAQLAAPIGTVVSYSYTGDYRIDTLIAGLDVRWNAGSSLGAPVDVTYSFMAAKPSYGGTDNGTGFGFSTFTAAQQTAVRTIFDRLETELNINFVEVADSATSYGQIRFGNNVQYASSGYAWLPGGGGDPRSGDVWIDSSTAGNLTPYAGSDGWAVLVHEIGHALGLKHPGNYNAGTTASSAPGNYLGTAEDNTNYTVMSYYDAQGGQPRDWFGVYDLLALKTFYGSNASHNAGDNTYYYGDTQGRILGIIDDAGGRDTINLSGLTVGASVDLRPGAFSSVGRLGTGTAVANLSIDLRTTIEDFVGSAYGDVVMGNAVGNRFILGGGTNKAEGLEGIDTAIYGAGRAAYSVSNAGGTLRVSGQGSNDTLTGVERLEFAGQKVAYDLAGNAGTAAKVLGAVFDGGSLANAGLAGVALSLVDGGMGFNELVHLALNARLGGSASHAAVVDLVFTNVVGVAPSAAQQSTFVSLLDNGTLTQNSFTAIAANTWFNEANIDLVGLAANGLAYT